MTIRITRVYTRTGDFGETSLAGGKRVQKDTQRIAAYGTLDELNAALGLVRAWNRDNCNNPMHAETGKALEEMIQRLQNEIFDLGSELATPPEDIQEGMYRVSEADVLALEGLIDHLKEGLEPLPSFVLPGGGKVSAQLHLARTICRRAEREIVALSRHEPLGEWVLPYINRFSDLLFVLSRWAGHHLGEEELLWERGQRKRVTSDE